MSARVPKLLSITRTCDGGGDQGPSPGLVVRGLQEVTAADGVQGSGVQGSRGPRVQGSGGPGVQGPVSLRVQGSGCLRIQGSSAPAALVLLKPLLIERFQIVSRASLTPDKVWVDPRNHHHHQFNSDLLIFSVILKSHEKRLGARPS